MLQLAQWIRESNNICVLIGAGVSVSCGIPDFRSAGGLYETLEPGLLTANAQDRRKMETDPTFVLSKELFMRNQLPYLELRKPFIVGLNERKWQPSATHRFLEMLDSKGKLRTLYSQNIDGLEFHTSIAKSRIISCHGSLSTIACEFCGALCDEETFAQDLEVNIKDIYSEEGQAKESTPIICKECHEPGLKPTTVLYGGTLPKIFFTRFQEDQDKADLLLIIGTSLEVGPANRVCSLGGKSTRRAFVNLGEFSEAVMQQFSIGRATDVVFHEKCDDVAHGLQQELHW